MSPEGKATVRHLIVFNAQAPEARVLEMAAVGQRELGAIAGVTDVRFGVSADPTARYRYLFDIGFAGEAVIESYRHDPRHVRFADEHFRPMAPDRLTIDYIIRAGS